MIFSISNFFLTLAQKKPLLAFFTRFFSYEGVYVMVVGIPLYLLYKSTYKLNMFSYLLISFLATWFMGETIKHLTRIPRPYQAHTIIPLFTDIGSSFPSLHASFAGVLIALACIFRFPLWYVVVFLSLCVGFSRVFGGVHYITDVLVGFILGGSITYGVYLFFTHYRIDFF